MKAKLPRRTSRRRRAGLSSVYGFIMIYLLVIASLQSISSALSSGESADAAAQQAGQVGQLRSLEHLAVSLSHGGNVTITNDGLIPSDLSFLLLQNSTVSKELPLQDSLAVGASVAVDAGSGTSFPSSVAVVTSLGNVFEASLSGSSPAGGDWKTLEVAVGGPNVDAQLYQNPSDPAHFFLAEGQSAFAFSAQTGAQLWSFDAGEGEITSVLPLADGSAYISDGYYGDQFTSTLFRVSASGVPGPSYTMRLLRLYTTVVVQYPNNEQPPYPVGSQPVQKGVDALYAYYDGWLMSSSGPSQTTIPADSYNLEGSDATHFYLYQPESSPGGFGCTNPEGNAVSIYAYTATAQAVQQAWTNTLALNTCDEYPNEPIATATGSGLLVSLFSQTYWTQPTYYGGPYPGANPFLAVLSSSTGSVLRSGTLDSSGYTSVATDGTDLFLAIPSSQRVEVLTSSGTGPGTFYSVGIPASTLLWEDGSLFAVSSNQVNVYGPSMNLEKTISFSPDTLYSLSNSKPLETQMVSPSFLVLNSTSYLALIRNSTGYGSLVVGDY